MLEIIFLIIISLIWLAFASIQDIKKNEIANWISFSLIIFTLCFRFFYSLFMQNNFSFFYQGLIGLGIFFLIGNIFYYGRLFAGGDGKLMIAMGTLLPFSDNLIKNINLYLNFIILFLFIGSIYGLIFSLSIGVKNSKKVKKEFLKQIKKNKKMINFFLINSIIFLIIGIYYSFFIYLGILIFVINYLFIYIKAIDKKCMIKNIKTKDLVEGDLLYKKVRIKENDFIKPHWEGLTKKQIKQLKKYKKEVKIKTGIAFVPVFLISFIIYVIFWFLKINIINLFY